MAGIEKYHHINSSIVDDKPTESRLYSQQFSIKSLSIDRGPGGQNDVLGSSFDNSPRNSTPRVLNTPPLIRAAAKPVKHARVLDDLIRNEWRQLPYVMMTLTASRMPWDASHLYWRDRKVQLGNMELALARVRGVQELRGYAAIYKFEDRRRDFLLHPSIEGNQLRWSAPGICDTVTLTTPQLGEKLLARLITFYTHGLPANGTNPTSSASPGPSS